MLGPMLERLWRPGLAFGGLLSLLAAPACGDTPRAHHTETPGDEDPECGDQIWEEYASEASFFVDAAGAAPGDGSRNAPFSTIQEGADAAALAGGAIVLIEGGDYAESLVLGPEHGGVSLIGRCRERVILDPTPGEGAATAILVEAEVGKQILISRMTISGGEFNGVRVAGGDIELRDLAVLGCGGAGVKGIGSQTTVFLESVEIRDSYPFFASETGCGIEVSEGAQLTARSCHLIENTALGMAMTGQDTHIDAEGVSVIRTRASDDGQFGYGVEAHDKAHLILNDSEILENSTVGVCAGQEGTTLEVSRTLIQGTLPGSQLIGAGVFVRDGAEAFITGCVIEGNSGTGIVAKYSGTEVFVWDTVVIGGGELYNHDFGGGVVVRDGAYTELHGVRIEGVNSIGISAYREGSSLFVEDAEVRDMRPHGSGYAVGLSVADLATAEVSNLRLYGCLGIGVATEDGAHLTFDDSLVEHSSQDLLGRYGNAVQTNTGSSVVLRGCTIKDQENTGILVDGEGTHLEIADSLISGTRIGSNVVASGLFVQFGGEVAAGGLTIEDTSGPSLVANLGATFSGNDCHFLDSQFAAVVSSDGTIDLSDYEIQHVGASANLGGGVGAWVGGGTSYGPSSLILQEGSITDVLAGSVWIESPGEHQIMGSLLEGGPGLPYGSQTRCGDAMHLESLGAEASPITLTVQESVVQGAGRAGVFLDSSGIILEDVEFLENSTDLISVGEGCDELPTGWETSDTVLLCPEIAPTTCDLEFRLTVEVAEIVIEEGLRREAIP